MKGMIRFRNPEIRPLPTDITPRRVIDAQLPMRVEALRSAIAKCEDLSELLDLRDQSEAIAAAAKVLRHTMPEVAKSANRICKEALLRLGQLLARYAGLTETDVSGEQDYYAQKARVRQLGKISGDNGIPSDLGNAAARLAMSPADIRESVLADDKINSAPWKIAHRTPPLLRGKNRGQKRSTPIKHLRAIETSLRAIDPKVVRQMFHADRRIVKKQVVVLIELLDAIDEACK